MDEFDVIVIGAGIMGSSAAYNCLKQGSKTLLLDQFPIPHSRGSSTGHSRITRRAYSSEVYAKMMPEAYKLWENLEKESHNKIFKKTGGVVLGLNSKKFLNYEETLQKTGIDFKPLDAEKISNILPNSNYYGFRGVYDPYAGMIFADKAVKSFQEIFLQKGGQIRENEKLVDINTGNIVRIATSNGVYWCKSLIICGGPWTNKILSLINLQLPLYPRYVKVCYWKVRDGIKTSGFPVLMDVNGVSYDGNMEGIYGTPPAEYPGFFKICMHGGKSLSNPDFRDESDDGQEVKTISNYVARHLPFLDPSPAIVETCMYTMTPDENYIIDRHPIHKNIFLGAGFSGHGFKLAPVVGKLLSEMVIGKQTTFDVTPFSISRFRSWNSKL